jgi:hypothetical protein
LAYLISFLAVVAESDEIVLLCLHPQSSSRLKRKISFKKNDFIALITRIAKVGVNGFKIQI